MNSGTSSSRRSIRPDRRIAVAILVLSLVGFADSAYLTVKHFTGGPLNCSVFHECEKVTTSPYATVGGVPLALLGASYYLVVFLLTMAYVDLGKSGLLRWTSRLTLVGFLASIYFVYLQLFVIRAICPYCMISAAASTLLFGLGLIVLFGGRTFRNG